jgi:hypothetical protein
VVTSSLLVHRHTPGLAVTAVLLRHAVMNVEELAHDADARCNMMNGVSSHQMVTVGQNVTELPGG